VRRPPGRPTTSAWPQAAHDSGGSPRALFPVAGDRPAQFGQTRAKSQPPSQRGRLTDERDPAAVSAHSAGEADLAGSAWRQLDRRRVTVCQPTVQTWCGENHPRGAVVDIVAPKHKAQGSARLGDYRGRVKAAVDKDVDELAAGGLQLSPGYSTEHRSAAVSGSSRTSSCMKLTATTLGGDERRLTPA
jgi:hypothetical protein